MFFDGTLWHENEMIEQGLLGKTGSRMGHINMSGTDGSIAAFAPLGVARKIYVHINNSNPALERLLEGARRGRGRRLGDRRRRHGGPAVNNDVLESHAFLNAPPLTPEAFEAAIRAVGAERYHDKHPFHKLLHGGKLNQGAGARLGAQSLLLSGSGAAQGRRLHEPRA